MFAGLNSLLDVKESQPVKGKFILISDNQNDGSFLVHYFLSLYIKGGFNVCFIALSQSVAHYSSVTQKLGANLTAALDSGQVEYIDGLQLISSGLANNQEERNIGNNPFDNIRDSEFSLQSLYNKVRKFVEQSNLPCLLLVDDISVLLTLGVSVQKLLDFCTYCTNLMCHQTSLTDRCFVCLVHCDDDADDDESLLLWKQLGHTADMELHVEGLSSGYCNDVHGQLVISKREDIQLGPTKQITTQFKVQDRVINFFAPGTSKAVL